MDISEFFDQNRKVAIAFSGGADSAYLLYEAVKSNVDLTAYYVKSQFQPEFEYKDALRLSEELAVRLKVIEVDVLSCDSIVSNTALRCYECKKVIFSHILNEALADGYNIILDGTNASDDINDRPGMKALLEYKVLSPLRICGITKDQVRKRSKEAGIFTWNKPAYACLATRVKTNEPITNVYLNKIELLEGFLADIGFVNHRLRVSKNEALLEIRKKDLDLYIKNDNLVYNEVSKHFTFLGIDRNKYREA